MNKTEILEAIKRITAENDGKPPGKDSFKRETGVRVSDWYPHLWLRWGDALKEAGFSANKLQTSINRETLIQKYIGLSRELGHLPVAGELRREAKRNRTFPSHTVFEKFGGKDKFVNEIVGYCKQRPGHDDILILCQNYQTSLNPIPLASELRKGKVLTGFVYLMKSGSHFKIGHTNSVGSRERQLAIKIPVPPTTIHSIETDDPRGIEAYWHKRFDAKRGEGEWFELSQDDVQAFKRWKRIA